jgi:hypothetical protein
MSLLNRPSHESRPLRPFAASALGLYLLVHAFLILCLVHPHKAHLQAQADDHLGSVCTWVHKIISSHVPSSAITLSLIVAALLTFVSLPQLSPETCLIRLTGRSPPLLALI